MSDKALVTQKQLDELLSVGYTGHDIGSNNIYPPVVNVLQSDKQYEAFQDKNSINIGMYGKLFIRKDTNTTKDLVDEISGTIIKIEKGYEVRSESDNSVVESGVGFMSADLKSQFMEKPGLKVTNMVKLLVAPLSSSETAEGVKKMETEPTKDNSPFALVVIKGKSFGSWFEAEDAMHKLAQDGLHKQLNQVPVTAFKVAISSRKEKNEKGQEFYSLDLKLSLNDISEALEFTKYMLEMKDHSMFYKVRESIERANEAKALREATKEEVFKKLEDKYGVEADDVVAAEDFPF